MRLATPGAVRRVPPRPAATPRPTTVPQVARTSHVVQTPYPAATQPEGGHR
ncbi:hypothetical protein ACFV0D_10430 [Streptomyces sp. NPDC059556]|uniref:hypothetical protein n=1 Tax=Streptomyces sp. NPDC059556 TaxID=3346863 RepID=UPI0036891506